MLASSCRSQAPKANVPLVTRYTYDGLGNLASVADAIGNKTTASYDSLSRLVSLVSPDAGTVQYRYALNGNLAEKVTAANAVVKYGYDVNRLKTITYPTTSMNVTYGYGASTESGDAAGNVASRIKSVTMEGGTETRTYDAFGNVNQTVTTLQQLAGTSAAPVVKMKYSYDWLGRIQKMTFPKVVAANWSVPTGDGEVVSYSYDNGGLLEKVSSSSDTYLADVGYDEFGRVMEKAGNNVVTSYTYDKNEGWLRTATATANPSSGALPFLATTYEYDLGGNVKKVTNAPTAMASDSGVGFGPMTVDYKYDEQDQLTSAVARYRGHKTWGYRYDATFAYDEIGNMISKSQKDVRLVFKSTDTNLSQGTDGPVLPTTTYTLTPTFSPTRPHQATSTTEKASSGSEQVRPATFDANGNKTTDLVGAAARTLTWDEENRLKTVADKVGAATITLGTHRYTPEGERTQRLNSNGRTTFYFNPYLVITDNLVMMKHIFAGDQRVAVKMESTTNTTPTRLFYHSDNVGSASFITDKNQNLVEHNRYFPFGEPWVEPGLAEHLDDTGAGAGDHRDWLFTGKELDTATGYHYFGARYYDAKASTWLSPDPILASYMRGRAGGPSQKNLGLYTYAWNNPVIIRDPDGRTSYNPNQRAEGSFSGGYTIVETPPPPPPPPPPSHVDFGENEGSTVTGQAPSPTLFPGGRVWGEASGATMANPNFNPDFEAAEVSAAVGIFIAGMVGGPAEEGAGLLAEGVGASAVRAGATRGGQLLLKNRRGNLLGAAKDSRLRNAIENLFRRGAKVGDGSTMDAVRFERETGQLLSPQGHAQKLIDRRGQLMKLRGDSSLSQGDQSIVHELLVDIQNALGR